MYSLALKRNIPGFAKPQFPNGSFTSEQAKLLRIETRLYKKKNPNMFDDDFLGQHDEENIAAQKKSDAERETVHLDNEGNIIGISRGV